MCVRRLASDIRLGAVKAQVRLSKGKRKLHVAAKKPMMKKHEAIPGSHAVALELADVMIYTVMLADRLGIDLLSAAYDKIAVNEARYPAVRVRGDARRAAEYAREDEEDGAP